MTDSEKLPKTSHVFYPICLGEVLNGRYLVENKMGSGGGSTVWIAHDLQDKRDVALKVMASGEWADNEMRMQNEIIQNVWDTSHLVTYLATFLLPGNGCHHRVVVFPLRGPCLDSHIVSDMSMATRMYAARQLLEALENLHKAGIIHRDLNERNCMWGMAPLHSLNRSAKYKTLGRPLRQIIPHVDLWKQGELVRPVEILDNLRTEDFYLSDFGLAIKLGDPTIPRGYPPPLFCSPERLHKKDPSFACDMWSSMVIFGVLYLGFPPFLSWRNLIKRLGPLPEQWKGLYTHAGGLDSWYDQSQSPDPDDNLASTIAGYRPDADPFEREHVLSITSKVFTYCPEKRPTATQLLQDPSKIQGYHGHICYMLIEWAKSFQ
ncbi:kinase-like domain-containing protein [Aspergillus parasiticus]|uniref:Kinase-like domain-containing protein n=1 Tax=Aspergillus parasiticus TaxID=5067 RepID=A0A5N6DRI3_ASPPA|nr:kinase-like domain-containing protein [Aspergillus parasiticus]